MFSSIILFGSFFKIGFFTFGGGFAGALTATIAVCIPSFLIIYLISLFFYRHSLEIQ